MVKPGYPGCSCDFSEGWESEWDGVGWGGGVGCWFPIHALVSKSPPAGFRFEPRVSDSVFLWFPIRFPLVSDSVSIGFRFGFLVSDSGFSGFRLGVSDSVLNPLCGTLCGWVWQVFKHQASSIKLLGYEAMRL